jgi:hypothetical protein
MGAGKSRAFFNPIIRTLSSTHEYENPSCLAGSIRGVMKAPALATAPDLLHQGQQRT